MIHGPDFFFFPPKIGSSHSTEPTFPPGTILLEMIVVTKPFHPTIEQIFIEHLLALGTGITSASPWMCIQVKEADSEHVYMYYNVK